MSYITTLYTTTFHHTEIFSLTLPVPTLYSFITTAITTNITTVYSYVISSIYSTIYTVAESSITTWLHPVHNTYLTHLTYVHSPPSTLATHITTIVTTVLRPFMYFNPSGRAVEILEGVALEGGVPVSLTGKMRRNVWQ